MQEVYGNLWLQTGDAVCITTNGFVKQSGHAVMGRGVALQAAKTWPYLPAVLGQKVNLFGNVTQVLAKIPREEYGYRYLVSLPVKHLWMEMADIELITRSLQQLVSLSNTMGWRNVMLPRPGCGNGQLDWKQVKPVVYSVLGHSSRFTVVTTDG